MNTTKKYMNLKMKADYYKKNECLREAKAIIENNQITGMSVRQLAAEIYTHAKVYYSFPCLPEIIRKTKFMQKAFRSAANGIDLEDNGDKFSRRICYSLIFGLC